MSTTPDVDWIADNAGLIAERLANGATLGNLTNIDDKHLEAVYTLGYTHYEAGRYKDAQQAFTFCVRYNHLEKRYFESLASCYQMLKKPADAMKYYTIASMLDIKDPKPTFHTAECLLAMGMVTEAKEALEIVIRQSKDDDKHKILLQRAEAMLEVLSKPASK